MRAWNGQKVVLGTGEDRGFGALQLIVLQRPYDFGESLYFPVDEGKLAEGARQRLAASIAEVAGAAPRVEIDPLVVEGTLPRRCARGQPKRISLSGIPAATAASCTACPRK